LKLDVCDRCGLVFKEEDEIVNQFYLGKRYGDVIMPNETKVDLCEDCHKDVVEFMFTQIERKEEKNEDQGRKSKTKPIS
jgi:hypothetical protein